MLTHHKGLSPERWHKFSLMEQLANIGSDVLRAIKWKNKNYQEDSNLAFERSLELFNLTISDPKNKKRLKEILRAREAWIDFFAFDNEYKTSDESWQNYFNDFNYMAALQRGR